MIRLSLGRRYYFSALHTIPQEDFIHGHNYSMDVLITGSQQESGWIYSRQKLDQLIQSRFIDQLDRSWVNDSILPATGENLARYAYEVIQSELPPEIKLLRIDLHETRKNSFTVVSQETE